MNRPRNQAAKRSNKGSHPQAAKTTSVTTTHTSIHQGPIPSPDVLEYYDQVQPGAAATIIKMAQDEQSHRHSIQKTELEAGVEYSKRGQIFALVVTLSAIAGGCYLGSVGAYWPAGLLFGSVIVALASAFLQSRSEKQSSSKSIQKK